MANGFPLSAVVGRREIMMEMEEIFFSGTFGGELLSLAAAKEVLTRYLLEDVCGKLAEIGSGLALATQRVLKENDLDEVIELSGHNSWIFLNWSAANGFSSDEIRTLFMQETFKRGVLVLSTHNVTLAHNYKQRADILKVYSEVAELLSGALSSGNLHELLEVEPLNPLFRVR
jgi:4-aminobutyrate aminotransferase-like enzyme